MCWERSLIIQLKDKNNTFFHLNYSSLLCVTLKLECRWLGWGWKLLSSWMHVRNIKFYVFTCLGPCVGSHPFSPPVPETLFTPLFLVVCPWRLTSVQCIIGFSHALDCGWVRSMGAVGKNSVWKWRVIGEWSFVFITQMAFLL